MFKLSVTYEGKKDLTSIQREFKNHLSESEILKTTAGALNNQAKRSKTQVATAIRKEGYTVSKKYLNRMADVTKPAKGVKSSLYAEVSYSYKHVPMIGFKHKESKKIRIAGLKGKHKAVTVEIRKGKSVLLQHSFVAKMKSGHVGIFGIGAYKSGKFIANALNSKGGRMSQLGTASPFSMALNKKVGESIRKTIESQLPDRLRAMLQAKVNKLKR